MWNKLLLTEFVIYLILFGWIDAVLVFTEYGGGGVSFGRFLPFFPRLLVSPRRAVWIGHIHEITWAPRQRREDLSSEAERCFESPRTAQASTAAALSRIYCELNGEFSLFGSLSSFLCVWSTEIMKFSSFTGWLESACRLWVIFGGLKQRQVGASEGLTYVYQDSRGLIHAAFLLRKGSFGCLWRERWWHRSS